MKLRFAGVLTLGAAMSALSGCGSEPLPQEDASVVAPQGPKAFSHEVLGLSFSYPSNWVTEEDELLFANYGVSFYERASAINTAQMTDGEVEEKKALRVAFIPGSTPSQLESIIQERMDAFANAEMKRFEVKVGGLTGLAISPVPGREATTQVYVAANDRVYRFSYPASEASPPSVLSEVRFSAPTKTLESLGLKSVRSEEVQFGGSRPMALTVDPTRDPGPVTVPQAEGEDSDVSALAYCGAAQPTDMFIGTQWGQYANNATDDGWSTGWTGAGPSWWNEGYHVRCSYTNNTNDYYAVDHSLNSSDLIYAPAGGIVKYAGWDDDPDGWGSYGRLVVVDLNYGNSAGVVYSNLNAHLSKILVTRGDSVNNSIAIGYAGGSGGSSNTKFGVHLHTAFYKGNSWTLDTSTREGVGGYLPYGGVALRWTKLTRTYDGGSYTGFDFGSRGMSLRY